MFFHMQYDVEIAGWSPESSRLTEPREADTGAIFHAGWHLGLHRTLFEYPAFSVALRARISDDTARTLTCGTCARNAEESLLIANLSSPLTGLAGHRALALRGSRTLADF